MPCVWLQGQIPEGQCDLLAVCSLCMCHKANEKLLEYYKEFRTQVQATLVTYGGVMDIHIYTQSAPLFHGSTYCVDYD